jgi:hypothetical protein
MRVYIFIYICISLQIILAFAGLNTQTGWVLSHFGINSVSTLDTRANPIYDLIFVISLLVAAAAAIPGFVGGFKFDYMVLVPAAFMWASFVGDFIWVMTYANGTPGIQGTWVQYLIAFIMIPLVIGYFFSIIAWWFGRD